MPEFAPGEAKIALAPITVSPSGMSCEAEIFLGPNEATKVVTSGEVPFTSIGAQQSVGLPITMPLNEGSYHPYIDVYAYGVRFLAYQAIEDVVIVSVPVAIYTCVYCRATFSNEAGLVSHMQANHPGKPYLVYAYPEVSQVASGGTTHINYKVWVPDSGDDILFLFPLEGVYCWTPYGCANELFRAPVAAGFYTGSATMYIQYMTDHFQFANISPGVYKLLSSCQGYWANVDTGLVLTVV